MTPQEHAEKIVNEYLRGMNGKATKLYRMVLAEMEEAVREDRAKTNGGCSGGHAQSFLDGQRKAYEECAKMVAHAPGCGALFLNEDECDCPAELSEAIRAKAAELK